MTTIDPQKILDELKQTARPKKRKSLDIIHSILEEQVSSGAMDFSIATIGRLSAKRGGPTAQSIRNQGGTEYRRLIDAWAAHHGAVRKRPLSPTNRQNQPTRDEDILKRIEDPAVRAVVGTIISERNRARSELRTLKAQTEFVVDRRPTKAEPQSSVQLLPSLDGLLSDIECEALQQAVSGEFLEALGWTAQENGRVRDEHGRTIYKPGYLTGLRKIVEELGNG